MYGEAPLSDGALAAALDTSWGLRTTVFEYRRIGYGSYHWLATAQGGSRWFVTVDSGGGPFAVRQAYDLARRLAEADLDFVRAPQPTNDGQVVVELGEWLVSAWPWLEGRSATYGEHTSVADLAATMWCVRRLHDFEALRPVPELVEDWQLSGRAALGRLMDDVGWGSGPYASEARELVLNASGRIGQDLAQYDELVELLIVSGGEFVITHGEPYAANVIHTSDGPKLIDWDTVRWAPKERDLWSLVDREGWRNGYGDEPVSADAVEVYRLQWELSEIAGFGQLLASAGEQSSDADVAMRELRQCLAN